MQEHYFSIKEAFREGFEKWKGQWGILALLFFITLIIGGVIPYILDQFFHEGGVGSIISQVMGYLIATFANLGLINATLIAAKNREAKVSDYFDVSSSYFRFLGAQILFQIMVTIGIILFIIPGIYLFVKYYLYPYFVVDKGLSPIEALKGAGQVVYGAKSKMLLFAILSLLLNILGAICLFIGLFITVPVVLIATAFIYLKLQSQSSAEIAQG